MVKMLLHHAPGHDRYVDNNLSSGETVIYRAKLHRMIFIWAILWSILAVKLLSGDMNGIGADQTPWAGFVALIAIIAWVSAIVRYRTSEFALTNKRVIMKTGFIKRQSLEVLLNKIEGVTVDQGVVGRMLGFGAITVNGIGGTRDPFRKISSPLEFRRQVQEQIPAS